MIHPDLQLALLVATQKAKEHDDSVFRVLNVLAAAIRIDPLSVSDLARHCEDWPKLFPPDEEESF